MLPKNSHFRIFARRLLGNPSSTCTSRRRFRCHTRRAHHRPSWRSPARWLRTWHTSSAVCSSSEQQRSPSGTARGPQRSRTLMASRSARQDAPGPVCTRTWVQPVGCTLRHWVPHMTAGTGTRGARTLRPTCTAWLEEVTDLWMHQDWALSEWGQEMQRGNGGIGENDTFLPEISIIVIFETQVLNKTSEWKFLSHGY